ncbi:hypothetical protein GGI12_000903 [Dipsacomyces acuminosporus]|nr:hypothetical protein GGI12_000903 [Dipsacomyces acuminosporus]
MSVVQASPNDSAGSADWAFKRLFKLESECRSQILGAQVQAVGQFSKLLDQFPFPTLVSAAFLKLGDLFRSSTSSLRYHIVQVFEASRHHLPRITHTEELLKRILTVLYSNDPIARVLALRLIGSASVVFAKYTEAQHGVLLRYQSAHPLEIAAAVRTTELLLKYSPEFLNVVWETVVGKANDTHLPDSVRAQLIHSLRHAGPNLQLSTVLYNHCRTWMSDPDNTVVIKSAALQTWKAIIQPHSELKCEDAEYISHFLSLETGSVRHATLGVLGKWNVQRQANDASAADVDAVRERLTTLIKMQMSLGLGEIDLSSIKLAALVLARIESVYGSTDNALCWELVQALAHWSLLVFLNKAPVGSTALDYLYEDISGVGSEFDGLHISSGTGNLRIADTRLRCTAFAAMLAISVAGILNSPAHKAKATEITVQTWRAISLTYQQPSQTKYTKRYLKLSWKWCRDAGTDAAVLQGVEGMLGSCNQAIAQATVAVSSDGPLSSSMASVCMKHIEAFSRSIDLGNTGAKNRDAAWLSIVVVLSASTRQLATHAEGSIDSNVNGANPQFALDAVSKWAACITSLAGGSAARSSRYVKSGPSAYTCLKLMPLLSACDGWATLNAFCKALPANQLSSAALEWVHAIASLAEAESNAGATEVYLKHVDRSLGSLRVLDNQGVNRNYQLSIIQLRRGFVQLVDDWEKFQPTAPPHPSSAFIARTLASRTLALAEQVNMVMDAFLVVDSITQSWLNNMQAVLGEIIRICEVFSSSGADADLLSQLAHTRDSVGKVIMESSSELRLGASFFSSPPTPSIAVETRPNLEGLESVYTVFSGTQFHVIVEGFVQYPQHGLPISPERVRVLAWLSQRPCQYSNGDLAALCKYNSIARQASRSAPNSAAFDVDAAGLDAAMVWDRAISFETPLDGTYFACPCAIPTPLLSSMFGQADTTIQAHIHISCALVDSSSKAWWIGPHKSYPLVISTTFKS